MAWSVRLDPRAVGELSKLDRTSQQRIVSYLKKLVAPPAAKPRERGKAMVGGPIKLWRYRVGDYRLVCQIDDGKQMILVLRIRHRKDVYR